MSNKYYFHEPESKMEIEEMETEEWSFPVTKLNSELVKFTESLQRTRN
jgi:hypothetical protein